MKRVTMNYKDNVHNGSSNANFMLPTYIKLQTLVVKPKNDFEQTLMDLYFCDRSGSQNPGVPSMVGSIYLKLKGMYVEA